MKKMLVAVDGSDHSRKVTNEASELAAALGAEVTLLTVMEEFFRQSGMSEVTQSDIEKINENRKKGVDEFLQEEAQKFREKGVKIKAQVAKGHPGQVICNFAREGGYSYIVLGNRGMGALAELLLGSVSNRVAHCAENNVIIIK